MVKVWRMENKKGKGPYQRTPIKLYKALNITFPEWRRTCKRRPSVNEEFVRNMTRKEFCGFLTIEQARRWFPANIRAIFTAHGFYLTQVPVSKVTAGSVESHQVLFIR